MNLLIVILIVTLLLALLGSCGNVLNKVDSFSPILDDDANYPSIIDPNVYYHYDKERLNREDRMCLKPCHLPHHYKIGHNYPVPHEIYGEINLNQCPHY